MIGKCSCVGNTVYFSAGKNLSKVKPGDFFQVEYVSNLLQINNIHPVSTAYPCQIKGTNITISQPIKGLDYGETVKIFYKIFEIDCFVVKDKGKGFANNTSYPARCKYILEPPEFLVTQVGNHGTIEEINIPNRGIFYSTSQDILEIPNTQTNAQIEVVFRQKEKKVQDVLITSFFSSPTSTTIIVDKNFPEINDGNLYFEKYVAEVDGDLPQMSRVNYFIFSEFTKNLQMPLLVPGSLTREAIVNKNFIILDSTIKNLENRINNLEKELTSLRK